MDRDPKVPRKYGPLLKLGLSLREIRRHTPMEIMLMHKALARSNVIEEGYNFEQLPNSRKMDMIREHPQVMKLREDYRYEIYLLQLDKKRRGEKEDA